MQLHTAPPSPTQARWYAERPYMTAPVRPDYAITDLLEVIAWNCHLLCDFYSGEVIRPATYDDWCLYQWGCRWGDGFHVDGLFCTVEPGEDYADPKERDQAEMGYEESRIQHAECLAEAANDWVMGGFNPADASCAARQNVGYGPQRSRHGLPPKRKVPALPPPPPAPRPLGGGFGSGDDDIPF